MIQRKRIVKCRIFYTSHVAYIIHTTTIKIKPKKDKIYYLAKFVYESENLTTLFEFSRWFLFGLDNYLECLTTAALGRPVVPEV